MKLNVITFCISIVLSSSVISCIDDGGAVEGNVTERATKTVTVLGYGFERGANSSGTELLARQNAIVSLSEQIKGARFEFSASQDAVDFSVKSDVTIPGMREYYKYTDRVAGKYVAIFIMGAEIEVEYPRPYGVFSKSYSDSGDSIATIVTGMKIRAVKDSIADKFGGKRPSKISGRLYITNLKVTPDGNDVAVDGTISLVFDSVTK